MVPHGNPKSIMLSMFQKIALVLLVVLALASGLYFFTFFTADTGEIPQTEVPGRGVYGNITTDSDPYDVEIIFTDEGYRPREITIKKGDRVRFSNDSGNEHWPASGVHPTHSLYPEKDQNDCLGSSFDACRALKKGEFWDFTFNREGQWRYHDHLRAYNTGTITVVAP